MILKYTLDGTRKGLIYRDGSVLFIHSMMWRSYVKDIISASLISVAVSDRAGKKIVIALTNGKSYVLYPSMFMESPEEILLAIRSVS